MSAMSAHFHVRARVCLSIHCSCIMCVVCFHFGCVYPSQSTVATHRVFTAVVVSLQVINNVCDRQLPFITHNVLCIWPDLQLEKRFFHQFNHDNIIRCVTCGVMISRMSNRWHCDSQQHSSWDAFRGRSTPSSADGRWRFALRPEGDQPPGTG